MISKKIFWGILVILILIRVAMVVALISGIPETPYHDGWYLHHGGDQEQYFKTANSILKLNPTSSTATLGFPLLLVPFVYIFNAATWKDILIPVVIFHAFLMFNLSTILLALITRKISKSNVVAIVAATLWTFSPYLLFLSMGPCIRDGLSIGGLMLTKQMWTQILSDPPSTFFVLLGIYLFLISLEREDFKFTVGSALIIGFAALIRIGNALLFGILITTYLFKKQWRLALCFGVFIFIAFMPQFLYNWYVFGSPLVHGLQKGTLETMMQYGNKPAFSISYLPEQIRLIFFQQFRYSFLLLVPIIFGFLSLYRKNKITAVFVLCWFLAYLIFYTCYYTTRWTPMRKLMPSIPAIIILVSSSLLNTRLLRSANKVDGKEENSSACGERQMLPGGRNNFEGIQGADQCEPDLD